MNNSGRSSVRWRIVVVYSMLFFVVMALVSVFLVNRIENYQLSSLKENITNTVTESNLPTSLGGYASLTPNSAQIQQTLDYSWSSFTEELSVVDSSLNICASTNENLIGRSAADVFDSGIIASCLLTGKECESDTESSGNIPVKNLCYAIKNGSITTGVVYVRADLSSINSFVAQSKLIFIQAIAIALVVTFILGSVLASSITRPINDVTNTVQKMSAGDFSEGVSVKSDDEIGQLAQMFNLLREKLDFTLSEISNEKNKLSTILTYMADGLVAIDLEGNIIHANPAARHMLDIDQDEDLSRRDYNSILGHISENMQLSRIKGNCEYEGGQDIFFTENRVFAVRYDRFKDEDGKDIGIIIIMQDITERQKLEDMQKDFVANVSHELKTPLTTVKSYTETLMDGAVDDPEVAQSFLEIIDNETDRMTRLVKDLLQLSRLDHRQEKMNFSEGDSVRLVKMCITKMDITAQQKQQQLNAMFGDPGQIRVNMDKDRMEQVLMNVLSNAIKYTQEGGRIDVDILKNGGKVLVTVSDNGIGMSAEELPRIFERFYRVDKARSRSMGGTGLGLAITKQIVEEHQGTIEAESSPGKGTKFTITLPISKHKGIPNIE
ncbi:MAG: cell wall metabolism sensor histidine kinase WalK [Clostridia bacterium]|nr:cell wall metabolism sensor histidine kinase WalK [Clostridia bacterium]